MKSAFTTFAVSLVGGLALAQGGNVTRAHTDDAVYGPLLDPNSDGFITASGGAFSTDSTEIDEFELPTGAVGGWVEIYDHSEGSGDISQGCKSLDIVTDANGGGIGYWIAVDPTPTSPQSGDEYLVIRVRVADAPATGNSGYNYVLSTDGLYGAGIDANAVEGNQGFEYEMQYSTGGGKRGVSGWSIDGLATKGAVNCIECVLPEDVQLAQAAVAGGCPGGSNVPTFISFAYPMSLLGMGSDIVPADLFIALATANSGNNTSVVGGGNVNDYGAFLDNDPSGPCVGQSGAVLFDCFMDVAHEVQQEALPVTIVSFTAERREAFDELRWTAADEQDFDRYDVERSLDGKSWTVVGSERGRGVGGRVESYRLAVGLIAGPRYYRLRAIDLDGSSETSWAVAVAGGDATSRISVTPNPVSDYLQLSWAASDARATFSLTAVDGRTVRTGNLAGGTAELDVSDLSRGAYVLTVASAAGATSQRIVKR